MRSGGGIYCCRLSSAPRSKDCRSVTAGLPELVHAYDRAWRIWIINIVFRGGRRPWHCDLPCWLCGGAPRPDAGVPAPALSARVVYRTCNLLCADPPNPLFAWRPAVCGAAHFFLDAHVVVHAAHLPNRHRRTAGLPAVPPYAAVNDSCSPAYSEMADGRGIGPAQARRLPEFSDQACHEIRFSHTTSDSAVLNAAHTSCNPEFAGALIYRRPKAQTRAG